MINSNKEIKAGTIPHFLEEIDITTFEVRFLV